MPRSLLAAFAERGHCGRLQLLAICLSHYRAFEGEKRGTPRRTGASFLARELQCDRSNMSKLLSEARREGWLDERGMFGERVRIPDGDFYFKVFVEDVRTYGAHGALAAAQARKLDKLRGERSGGGLVLSARRFAKLLFVHVDTARRYLRHLAEDGLLRRQVRQGFACVYSLVSRGFRPSGPPADAQEPLPPTLPGDETRRFAEEVLADLAAMQSRPQRA